MISAYPISPTFSQANGLQVLCRYLAGGVGAVHLWVGLPEEVRQFIDLPGALPVGQVLAHLPEDVRIQYAAQPACLAGQGLVDMADFPSSAELYWMVVPLRIDEYSPGTALVARQVPFEPETAAELAGQISLLLLPVIEHALYRQALLEYHASMGAMHSLAQLVSTKQSVHETLKQLAEALQMLTYVDAVHLYVYEPHARHDNQFGFCAVCRSDDRQAVVIKNPVGSDLMLQAAERRKPVMLENVQGDLGLLESGPVKEANSVGIFPLLCENQMLGVCLLSSITRRAFTPVERLLFPLYMDQVAATLANAWAAQDLRNRLIEMTTLYDLAQKSSASLDPQEVLQTIVHALKRLFKAYAATIMLLDERGDLRVAATAGLPQKLVQRSVFPIGEGIGGQVVLTGKVINVADIREHPHYQLVDPYLRSILVVPLFIKGQVIGTLSLDSHKIGWFSADTERLLTIAAAQAATALENARLYQEERRRADELNTLIDLSRSITQNLELDQVFVSAHMAISRLMPCEAFVISLRDRQTHETQATYLIDKGKRYPPTRWPAEAGLSGYVMKTGKSLLIHNLQEEQYPFIPINYGDKEHVFSLIAVPLCFGGEMTGMVATESYQPNIFTQHDLHLLETIANHIAIALQNSYMYLDLQKRFLGLQEIERVRAEFIQNVSHELRTPLTFVRAYVELLLNEEMGSLNTLQHQALNVVQNKTATLVHLVADITTLETRGDNWLVPKAVNLIELTRSVIGQLQEVALKQKIYIEMVADDELPLVECDPDRIAQALDNLIGNAIKYGVSSSLVRLRIKKMPTQVIVSVSDQGEGIAEDEQTRIFDSFYQVDGSPSRRHGGLGLGLAIVKHIIEAHGGAVWVESAPNAGSTFYFTLPYLFRGGEESK